MSQEFLSHMLGSTRPAVMLAAGRLKKERLITYERAEITIVDRKGLEKRACECYGVINQYLNNFAAFDTDDIK
jgi:Mn-dependent DtxR family transcriptional regulator